MCAGSQGTVTVTGAGSTWSNSSGVNIGNLGTGTLTIADGGVVSAGPIVIATNAGAIGTLNIGAGAGNPAAAPGTLTAPSLAFGAGTGTLNFNHTSTNYVFAPTISGNGYCQCARGHHHANRHQHLHRPHHGQRRRADRERLDCVVEPDDGEQRRRTHRQRHRGLHRRSTAAAFSFPGRWECPAR